MARISIAIGQLDTKQLKNLFKKISNLAACEVDAIVVPLIDA